MNDNPLDEPLIKAWKIAAQDLGLEIIAPIQINTENGMVTYPALIKYFGRKNGTLIARYTLFIDNPIPKYNDYYFSALNAECYTTYNRENFIETLEDWGYYGGKNSKPEWYNGHVYESGLTNTWFPINLKQFISID